MEFCVMKYYQMIDESRAKDVIKELMELNLNKLKKDEICSYYNVYGYALIEEKKFEEARDIYLKYLDYTKSIDEPSYIHKAYHQLAMVERMDGNYKLAIEYIELEKDLIDKYFDSDELSLSVNGYEYAYLLFLTGKLDLAEEKMNKALEYANLSNDLISVACCYRGLGEIFEAKSTASYKKSIELFKEAGDLIGAEEVEKLLNK